MNNSLFIFNFRMLKFLSKILYFILPIYLCIYFVPKIYYSDKGIEKGVLAKFTDLYPLVKNKKCVVFAGDSRSERQIDPAVIERITGLKTINLAISSGELVSFLPYLKFFNPDSTLFVFSTSSWQTNDGAITPGYISLDSYVLLNFYQRLHLYKNNIVDLIKIEDRLIRSAFKDLFRGIFGNVKQFHYDSDIIKHLGFFGVNKPDLNKSFVKTESISKAKNVKSIHPWYRDLEKNGYRNLLFKDAIRQLGGSKFKIYMYQPPVDSSFYFSNWNTPIGKFENSFSKNISTACSKFKNITFLNFYDSRLSCLSDSLFYDPQHLNAKGARIFSSYIAKVIKR